MPVGRAPRRLVKYAIAAPIAPPPHITTRVPELIAATVYNLWRRASNMRERSPHKSVACPALVVFMRHLTRSLLRANGLSQALGRLGRGRRNHCDDALDRFARERRDVDPRPAGIGEKIGVVRQRRESRL